MDIINNDKPINGEDVNEPVNIESVIDEVNDLNELDALEKQINEGLVDVDENQEDDSKQEEEIVNEEEVLEEDLEDKEEEEIDEVDKKGTVKAQKTEITDDLRTQLNIPEKFKYVEDYSRWGSEAEKQKTRVEQDRADILKNQQELEKKIAYLEGLSKRDNVKTPEELEREELEREAMNEKFRQEYEEDPIGAMAKIFEKQEKLRVEKLNEEKMKIEEKNKQEAFVTKIEGEKKMLMEAIGEDEFNAILPELQEIAKKNEEAGTPINSVLQVYAIHKIDKDIQAKKMRLDSEKKKQTKKKVFTEKSSSATVKSESRLDKIGEALTVEELDKAIEGL